MEYYSFNRLENEIYQNSMKKGDRAHSAMGKKRGYDLRKDGIERN